MRAGGPLSVGSPVFNVTSGPCTVSDGGRCVGRAEGYGPSEQCAITVGGTGGGVLAPCAVFDMLGMGVRYEHVTLPGGARYYESDCPEGAVLTTGDVLGWASDGAQQGSVGLGQNDNGCAAKGTCAAPFSQHGLGGGWQLCFA